MLTLTLPPSPTDLAWIPVDGPNPAPGSQVYLLVPLSDDSTCWDVRRGSWWPEGDGWMFDDGERTVEVTHYALVEA